MLCWQIKESTLGKPTFTGQTVLSGILEIKFSFSAQHLGDPK